MMFFRSAIRYGLAISILTAGILTPRLLAANAAEPLTLADALRQVNLFKNLTDAERDLLQAAASLRRGSAGERIIEQNSVLDKMVIILEAQADVLVNGQHIVTLAGQPLVGEIEFLDGLPASADVVLREASFLIEVTFDALTNLMEREPRVGYVIMREIARIEAKRLRDTNPK